MTVHFTLEMYQAHIARLEREVAAMSKCLLGLKATFSTIHDRHLDDADCDEDAAGDRTPNSHMSTTSDCDVAIAEIEGALVGKNGTSDISCNWIAVTERLPEAERNVLIYVPGWKGRRLRAMWCPRWTVESRQDEGDDADEYHEERDQYYVREGWYETNEFEETHWKVAGEVTHWMPLPEPPKSPTTNVGGFTPITQLVECPKCGQTADTTDTYCTVAECPNVTARLGDSA